jgi:acyl dehydratase
VHQDSSNTDELKSFIGKEVLRETSRPVSEADIWKWAIAVYWPDPPPRLYWDQEYARGTRFGGIVAPQEFNPFAWSFTWNRFMGLGYRALDAVVTRMGLKRGGLNGGSTAEYWEPIRPGDVITAVTEIEDVSLRQGSRFGLMALIVFKTTEWNQRGQAVRSTRVTTIRY